jgi:hypothetical protein
VKKIIGGLTFEVLERFKNVFPKPELGIYWFGN